MPFAAQVLLPGSHRCTTALLSQEADIICEEDGAQATRTQYLACGFDPASTLPSSASRTATLPSMEPASSRGLPSLVTHQGKAKAMLGLKSMALRAPTIRYIYCTAA